MRLLRPTNIAVAMILTLSVGIHARLRIWPHKNAAQTPVVPYEPKPDAAQPTANTDVPAAQENPVQTVSEPASAIRVDEVSSVVGAEVSGSAVQAIKGSTLLLDGISGQHLYDIAMQYLGRPYRSGASGPAAFDCSGFTSYVYRRLNISLSRSSRDQFLEGVPVARGSLRVGDLVFFARGGNRGRINHVGMVCEVMPDGDFKFVHACSRGVSIDNFGTAAYYQSRYVGARRIIAE